MTDVFTPLQCFTKSENTKAIIKLATDLKRGTRIGKIYGSLNTQHKYRLYHHIVHIYKQIINSDLRDRYILL